MAALLLGPLLRYVGETEATVWVEADAPGEVSVLGASTQTFCVDGHHYALVTVAGLEPGETYEYEVQLEGEQAWPPRDEGFPPSLIRTLDGTGAVRVVFGSCRVSRPHHPPFALEESDDGQGHGIDALRTMALRMRNTPADEWPHLLLMLGDQIYADELSPAMRAVTESRSDSTNAPRDELASFSEYALAYREAWGEPVLRWLLSTLPSAMVFDDHEIHAEWKISQAWLERMRRERWYDGRISSGLAAYWIYQHLGNLSPDELRRNELLARVRGVDDAGPLLRDSMRTADRQPGHSRWSYCRDLGHTRLVVIDSRAGRELRPGERRMVDEGEWEWIAERATGDFEHLLLASSVPFVLTAGLHFAEAWDEALSDGAWGGAAARLAEHIRQRLVMDHWASFRRSFRNLAQLLEDVATGRRGKPPASIVMLSGDVHHCYLAEVGFRRGTGAQSAVWQAVCSAYRKELAPREKLVMRLGTSRAAAVLARALARAGGVEEPPIEWRLVERPGYDNQVGTLELAHHSALVRVETTRGADWRAPQLRTLFEHRLTTREPSEAGATAA